MKSASELNDTPLMPAFGMDDSGRDAYLIQFTQGAHHGKKLGLMRTLEKHNVTVAYLVLKNWEQRLDGIDFLPRRCFGTYASSRREAHWRP